MNLVQGRRCSPCGLTWPIDLRYYRNCPECGGITSAMSLPTTAIMSDEEALKRLNRINFYRYTRGEKLLPAPETKSEKEPVQRTTPDHIRKERLAKFDGVIQGAGFSKAELDTLKQLEEQVGRMKPSDSSDG